LRPTLLFIPNDWLGMAVFTADGRFGIGLVLGAVLLVGAAVLWWRWRRHGWGPQTRSLLSLLGVIVAGVVFVLPHILVEEHGTLGLAIRGYGAMVVLALVAAVVVGLHRARHLGINSDMLMVLAMWMFVLGMVGARALYVWEYWDNYRYQGSVGQIVAAVLNVTQGGLIVYGGFLGAAAAFALFVWRHGLPALPLMDLLAPSLILAQGIGRLGCFLNGCCYGGLCDVPQLAVHFPWGSPPHVRQVERGQVAVHGLRLRADTAGPKQHALLTALEDVDPASAAYQAGLRAGDRIAAIGRPWVDQPARRSGDFDARTPDALVVLVPRGWIALGTLRVDDFRDAGAVLTTSAHERIAQLMRLQELQQRVLFVERPPSPNDVARYVQAVRQAAVPHLPSHARLEVFDAYTELGSVLRVLIDADGTPRRDWVLVLRAGSFLPVLFRVETPLPRSLGVHPTQLYSAVDGLLIFFFLWSYFPRRRRDGEVAAWLLTIAPATRFLMEMVRTDEPGMLWGMTLSQLLGLGLLAGGLVLWAIVLRRPKGALFRPDDWQAINARWESS
jgi:prolipoprotein diacylglyceryltransferase